MSVCTIKESDQREGIEGEDAYSYALNRCLHGSENDQKEFSSMLIEWFYSGNWIEED